VEKSMDSTSLRSLTLLLIYNVVAVLVAGKATLNAARDHDFVWALVFGLVAMTYVLGLLLGLIRHPSADPVNRRLRAGGIYFLAAFTTAVTADDLMYITEMAGRPFSGWSRLLLYASLAGSFVMALAVLAILIKPRYGHIAALVGSGFLFPYFALLAWNMPWRDFVWLVTIHWDGKLEVLALISLAAATAYSIEHLVRIKRTSDVSSEKLRTHTVTIKSSGVEGL
jgi:hypothetical protein